MIKKSLLMMTSVLVLLTGCGSTEVTKESKESTNTSTNNSASTQAPAGDAKSQNYSFSSGQPDGAMYPLAVTITNALKNYAGYKGEMNIFPGGALSNVMNVNDGKAQFGVSYSSAVTSALKGEEPFGKPHDQVTQVVGMFPFYAHWITLPDSDINSVEDLKGKRVNLGVKGQASRLVAEEIFEVYGIKESDLKETANLGYSDAFQKLKDGQFDAVFWQQNAPYSSFSELAQTTGMKLIPIDQDKLVELQKRNPGMIPSVIKAGTYKGQTEDIPTVKTPLSIIASKDLDEQLVYDLVKGMDENFATVQEAFPPLKELKGPEEMAENIGVEFHPGAKKYFQEKGWLK